MSHERSSSPSGPSWSSKLETSSTSLSSSSSTGPANIAWAAAKSRSNTQTTSFAGIGRHFRKVSNKLPLFAGKSTHDKHTPGRPSMTIRDVIPFIGRLVWKSRLGLVALIAIVVILVLSIIQSIHLWRSSSYFGGGSKFVIILATNLGGGVMEWKGPREWAIERDSIRNKKSYAKKWGYHLEQVDMSTKKRYAHEWRESWEKVDVLRDTMRKYPKAEWFWWLDLHTFIMEPTYSLQKHVFQRLAENTYRDINVYNPLNISHPPTDAHLDWESRSATGDNKPSSINMIIPQDCSGFNLGSFLVRRSAWTDQLLDIWWDPVGYEQKHMEWEHKEQDALEWIYAHQPWARAHVAFIPQRRINSFPLGACGEKGPNDKIHYAPADRDFVVNMAGCQWGRDCWGEMFEFRAISARLNRSVFVKMRDWVVGRFRRADADKNV